MFVGALNASVNAIVSNLLKRLAVKAILKNGSSVE